MTAADEYDETSPEVRAAWFDFYARENQQLNEELPPLEPEHPTIRDASIVLRALARVLNGHRRRTGR